MTSLDGRRFVALSNSSTGQVGDGTVFQYHESEGRIWAEYGGGQIERGYLVGTRLDDELDFRYVHLDTSGATATGHCRSRVGNTVPLTLHEDWEWESHPGRGTSVLTEVTSPTSAN